MELKPCPFCGDNTGELRESNGMRYVECGLCKAQGPFVRDEPKGLEIKKWNERSTVEPGVTNTIIERLQRLSEFVKDCPPVVKTEVLAAALSAVARLEQLESKPRNGPVDLMSHVNEMVRATLESGVPKPSFTVEALRKVLEVYDHEMRGSGIDDFEISRFLEWIEKRIPDEPTYLHPDVRMLAEHHVQDGEYDPLGQAARRLLAEKPRACSDCGGGADAHGKIQHKDGCSVEWLAENRGEGQ